MSAGLEFEKTERIENIVEEVIEGPLSTLSVQSEDVTQSSSTFKVPELTEVIIL